ncbi:MAG: hypothetical protein M1524_01540 [Patescibacteria group bacterium]|nr:hypothetical protein [Patescibacteria group bacterium]
MKKTEKGSMMILVLIVVLIVASAWLVSGVRPQISSKNLIGDPASIVGEQVSDGNQDLQLGSLKLAAESVSPTQGITIIPTIEPSTPAPTNTPLTPTPTRIPTPTSNLKPGDTCPMHAAKPIPDCVCPPGEINAYKCRTETGFWTPICEFNNETDLIPNCPPHAKPEDCQPWCELKPVIYLYPTKETLVNVEVLVTGKVVVSDPLYENGWKNVRAYPDGKLIYKGKEYKELFYEASLDDVRPPKNGFVIKTENLRFELDKILTKIGLIKNEKEEFLDFWVGKMSEYNSPYVLFSLIDKDEKDRVDRIIIQPEPDTRIEFLAYFKPLNNPISVSPLILPDQPPKRIGFVEVEWGGTIDYQ